MGGRDIRDRGLKWSRVVREPVALRAKPFWPNGSGELALPGAGADLPCRKGIDGSAFLAMSVAKRGRET